MKELLIEEIGGQTFIRNGENGITHLVGMGLKNPKFLSHNIIGYEDEQGRKYERAFVVSGQTITVLSPCEV